MRAIRAIRVAVAAAACAAAVACFEEPVREHLERPAVDLWRALAALEGRWLSPDLVTAMIAPVPHEQQPEPDPESFATLTRRFRPAPSPPEVAAALRAELVPPELHRVRWRSEAADVAGLEGTDPRSLLDAAQTDLPS